MAAVPTAKLWRWLFGCREDDHEWGEWSPVSPDRVLRDPTRDYLEHRFCRHCHTVDMLRIHNAVYSRRELDQYSTNYHNALDNYRPAKTEP